MEAVVEQLDIKRALLERVDAARSPGSIVSSNTSGIPIATPGGRTQRRLPQALARHPLLQPAALPAPGRGDPDRRHRSRRHRTRLAVLRSPSRQGRRPREGPTELHRQPPRALRRDADLEGARERPLHHRGNRRDDRSGARPAEQRHVPDDGHRRRRYPGARRQEPRLRAAGVRARDDRERHGRREGRDRASTSGSRRRTAARSRRSIPRR